MWSNPRALATESGCCFGQAPAWFEQPAPFCRNKGSKMFMRWPAQSLCLVNGDCHLGPWHAMLCLAFPEGVSLSCKLLFPCTSQAILRCCSAHMGSFLSHLRDKCFAVDGKFCCLCLRLKENNRLYNRLYTGSHKIMLEVTSCRRILFLSYCLLALSVHLVSKILTSFPVDFSRLG